MQILNSYVSINSMDVFESYGCSRSFLALNCLDLLMMKNYLILTVRSWSTCLISWFSDALMSPGLLML